MIGRIYPADRPLFREQGRVAFLMPSVTVITATFRVVMAAVSIPSHRREDMRELLRKEITRDRKRTVQLAESISWRTPLEDAHL
jgi:hypothetical protein